MGQSLCFDRLRMVGETLPSSSMQIETPSERPRHKLAGVRAFASSQARMGSRAERQVSGYCAARRYGARWTVTEGHGPTPEVRDREEVSAMADIVKREPRTVEPFELIDRMFEDWSRMMPMRRPFFFRDLAGEEMIRVDEFRDGKELVIRAELPGIDPDKDVELTVSDGMLHIQAERREEEHKDEKGYHRRELRYGSFSRSLPLPGGVKETDINAAYKDGILEIRVPTPKDSATRVPISKK
jgi:HSP20 family protein